MGAPRDGTEAGIGSRRVGIDATKMAHNFSHNDSSGSGEGLGRSPKAVIDRFLDAIWMERGLSENTLGAYRADLLALTNRLDERGINLLDASRADVMDYISWRVEGGAKPRSTARQLSSTLPAPTT